MGYLCQALKNAGQVSWGAGRTVLHEIVDQDFCLPNRGCAFRNSTEVSQLFHQCEII